MGESDVLLVAHRAGNDLHALRMAEEAGVDLVEADVWHWRDRIEIRHSKTMGPIPLLWDRWSLAPGWTPRLSLERLVQAADPQTELMLDLKGSAADLPARVIEAMSQHASGRAYTVSSQWWEQLAPFEQLAEARVVYSVGNDRMRADLEARLSQRHADGIAIHQRLLTPERVDHLRQLASRLFTWPINDRARFAELVDWGVNGIISDRYGPLLEGRHSEAAS